MSISGNHVGGKHFVSPAMQADPYAVYRELRELDPVHWDDDLRGWVVTRYDDAAFVLNDARFSSNRIAAADARLTTDRYRSLLDAMSNKMSERDEPDHARLRSLVNTAFAHVAVDRWEPRIRQRVETLLDGIRASGRCEFIQDFAVPLPLMTILELVGVPASDHRQVKQWCDDFAAVALNYYTRMDDQQAERGLTSLCQFREYLEERVELLRDAPGDNLLSALIQVEHEGARLSMEELLANSFLLLSAGNETTTCLLGNGLLALLRHPDQMRLLRDEPGLAASAVEEVLRFDGPVQYLGRVALDNVDLRGKAIRKGELVLAVIAAANRDPDHFADAESFQIRRSENHHLAFGHGRHFCVGSQFARLEARLAFEALVTRTRDISLDSIWEDDLQLQHNANMRGVKELPLKLEFVS